MFAVKGIHVSATTSLFDLNAMFAILNMTRQRKIMMEAVILLDPALQVVRIRKSVWDSKSATYRTLFRAPPEATHGILSLFSRKIRPVNLKTMHFDCVLPQGFTVHLLRPIGHGDADAPENTSTC
jgi:hypothetical protein